MEKDKRKRYEVNGRIRLFDPDDPLLPKNAKLIKEPKPKAEKKPEAEPKPKAEKKAVKPANKAVTPETK